MVKHANFQLVRAYPDKVIWEKLTIDDEYVNKRVQLFSYQTNVFPKQHAKKKNLLERCNKDVYL